MSPEGTALPRVKRSPFEMPGPRGGVLRGDVRSVAPDASASPSDRACECAIVVCHGFKGFKDWGFFPYLAERLAIATGATVASLNFSGSGIGPDLESFTDLDGFGHNTFSREVADLEAILEGLREGRLGSVRLDRPGAVGLIGHSRGAAAVILAGARDPAVQAVVTWAGIGSVFRYESWFAESLRDTGVMEIVNSRTGQRLPLYRDVLDDLTANRGALDMEAAARRLGSKLLVVHGSEDEAVPVAEAHALHEAAGGSGLAIIDGAGHTMGASHPFPGPNPKLDEAVSRSADHFNRHLGSRS